MNTVAAEIRRPLVMYFGGKFRLAPWIIANLPEHRRYVEPFGGSGAVLLRKPRVYAEIYNDLNGDMVHLFRTLRDPDLGPRLVEQVRLTPFAREEFERSYEHTDEPVERARRLIVRGMMGYGSTAIIDKNINGFRAMDRSAGKASSSSWSDYPDSLALIVQRLQGVVVEQRDAFELIQQQDDADTLFYVDPPYVHETRSHATRCRYSHEFSELEHLSLASLLHQVKGRVAISGYPSDLYSSLYGDWEMRTGAGRSMRKTRVTECLWIKP